MTNFIVVSFFTSEYCNEALRLMGSLDKFSISYDIKNVASKGSWITNVNYKSEYCRDKLLEHNMSIVWLDCDAEVVKYPKLFDYIGDYYDMGCYYRNRRSMPHELLSGTLYFSNTTESLKLLESWTTVCKANSMVWDQRNLQRVIYEHDKDLKIFEFPSSYVRIFDAQDMRDVDPVILHYQASRKLKRMIT
jgi:hypothetical protein